MKSTIVALLGLIIGFIVAVLFIIPLKIVLHSIAFGMIFFYVIAFIMAICTAVFLGYLFEGLIDKTREENSTKEYFKNHFKGFITSIVIILAILLGGNIIPILYYSSHYNSSADEDTRLSEQWNEETSDSSREQYPDLINWSDACNHIDETVTIVGPVVTINEPGVTGNPVFIDIGESYPSEDRVTAVIWDENRDNFDDWYQYEGETVYITGEPYYYDGVVNIRLSDEMQIEIK